ncbi:hypothetical protein ACHMW5_04170 [Azospirillum melinis]|uniref:hypothetical protein n=1 Tax=Azospirillum melinis TaxID=328839 RepID=UPI003756FD13
MSDKQKQTISELVRQTEIARARVIEQRMVEHTRKLTEKERERLAINLGKLLQRAKEAGIAMGEVVAKSGVAPGTAKPENALGAYRIYEGGKRIAKPRLHGTVGNYHKLAMAAAELVGIPEYEAILALTQGTILFEQRVGPDAELGPAEQVCTLLTSLVKEVIARHDLDGYFREVTALRVLPDWEWFDNVPRVKGWQSELYSFDFRETDAWPSVLLTAVIRSSAPARLLVDDKEMGGEVMYVEKAYLTLGWNSTSSSVRPYLEFKANTALRPTGRDAWFRIDAPWTAWGYPPPTGMGAIHSQEGKVVKFEIRPGSKLNLPGNLDAPDSRELANQEPYSCSRLERLEPAVLIENFVDRHVLKVDHQFLPIAVDASSLLSPPGSTLAVIEGVLLARESIGTAQQDFGSMPGFIEELDRKASMLTSTFREWRLDAKAKAREDHRRLLVDVESRLAELRMNAPPPDETV